MLAPAARWGRPLRTPRARQGCDSVRHLPPASVRCMRPARWGAGWTRARGPAAGRTTAAPADLWDVGRGSEWGPMPRGVGGFRVGSHAPGCGGVQSGVPCHGVWGGSEGGKGVPYGGSTHTQQTDLQHRNLASVSQPSSLTQRSHSPVRCVCLAHHAGRGAVAGCNHHALRVCLQQLYAGPHTHPAGVAVRGAQRTPLGQGGSQHVQQPAHDVGVTWGGGGGGGTWSVGRQPGWAWAPVPHDTSHLAPFPTDPPAARPLSRKVVARLPPAIDRVGLTDTPGAKAARRALTH